MQKPPGARDGELRGLLLAGFAQLDALALPAHAALSATVEAARAMGRAHQAGMVNALLRRAQRDGIPAGAPEDAWPQWLRERIEADWPGQAGAIFAASAAPAPTWLRVNRGRSTVEAAAQRLREAGVEAQAVDGLSDALRIDTPVSPLALPGFAEGAISVQDAAAQRVADALSPPADAPASSRQVSARPASGRRVLDACAAPGGKSAHLLERDPSLRLTAIDADARRLRRMRETFERLGLAGAQLRAADAADTAAWWDGEPYEAILVDAPCSATGIVRRQPDVLLHRRPSDLAALTALQARLLDALWPLLAPGGILVYATCSILREENERQVEAFLARTPDAAVDPLAPAFGHAAGVGRQRLPGEAGMDGFFYARLKRTDA